MNVFDDSRRVLLSLTGVAAYLYVNLFVFPRTPVLLSGDQVYFWMFGQRMLAGECPYRDFFQFTPPGADLIYLAAFKLLGLRVWVTNMVVWLLGVALCGVCYQISRRIMDRQAALLATLLYVTLIYSRLLNATHHFFSVLAVMSAVAIYLRKSDTLGLAFAGTLLGIASFFTQTHGVVAFFAFSLFLITETGPARKWRDFWKAEEALLAGFLLTGLCLEAHFLIHVGLRQLIYFQVYYVWKIMVHRPETALLGMPVPSYWRVVPHALLMFEYAQMVFVYAVLPVSYLLAFRRNWRKSRDPAIPQREIVLLAFVGAFLLGELGFSLNWLRLYAVSMPGIILFIWLLTKTHAARRYLVTAVCIGIVALAVQRVWFAQQHYYQAADLPGGWCATEPKDYEKLSWVMRRTKPGDFFFQAGWPGMYIPLGLRNPLFLDKGGTMLNPRWAQRAVDELSAKQVRYVFWVPQLDYPVDPHRLWATHIVPLRNYLHATYRCVHVFPDGEEAWERK